MSESYFEIGKPISDDRFFGRTKELRQLDFFVSNSQSIVVVAPRRYGKTSLVKKYLSGVKDKLVIEIDLMRFAGIREFSDALIDKALENIGYKKAINQMKSGMLSFSKKLASMIKIDLGVLELDGFERFFHIDDVDDDEYLLYAFEFVEKFAASMGKKAVVFIDEFAELPKLSNEKILAKLRSIIQHQQHTAYIFAGSQPTLMNKIFLDKNEPFFKFATVLSLGAIEKSAFAEYLNKLFAKEGIACDDEQITDIYEFCGGVAYYLSLFMMLTLMGRPVRVDDELTKEMTQKVLEVCAFGFENEILALKRRKYFLATTLMIAKGENPYTIKTTQRQNINAVIKNLELDGVVVRQEGGYALADKVFGAYLLGVMEA